MRTGLRSQYKTAKDITDDVVFMSRVRIDETTGCWVWTATLFTKGYAASGGTVRTCLRMSGHGS